MKPDNYYADVAAGVIKAHHAELQSFTKDSVVLSDGTEITCDVVVLALGSKAPEFPFLPKEYRQLLEGAADGT